MSTRNRPPQTVVLSDIHLSEAGTIDPKRPLWKRFKLPEYFVDEDIESLLDTVTAQHDCPAELVLNGDIFDFDSVTAQPPHANELSVSWLERRRGLAPEECKSVFKIQTILRDHPLFVGALQRFLAAGHRVVFVIGNHDVELHWPRVQAAIRKALTTAPLDPEQLRFCEWFYVSNGDTLLEHGNQYDDYCLVLDPIHPVIEVRGRRRVRLPFGNLCCRFMLNGMGLMNPHVDAAYIKPSLRHWLVFFYRKVARTQPLLVWTWFWSACVSLWFALREGLLPAQKDPMGFRNRVEQIAARSNVTPEVVLALREVHIHPAVFRPWKIAQELWLDRVIIFGLLFYAAMELISLVEVFVKLHPVWTAVMILLIVPPFLFYTRSVRSRVSDALKGSKQGARMAAQIAGVKRVVHGHTHVEMHTWLEDGVEYLNAGTWSPAFEDLECTQPYGRRCFAWIRPSAAGERAAGLFAWTRGQIEPLAPQESVRVGERTRPEVAPAAASVIAPPAVSSVAESATQKAPESAPSTRRVRGA